MMMMTMWLNLVLKCVSQAVRPQSRHDASRSTRDTNISTWKRAIDLQRGPKREAWRAKNWGMKGQSSGEVLGEGGGEPAKGSGECWKVPQRGPGHSPGHQTDFAIFKCAGWLLLLLLSDHLYITMMTIACWHKLWKAGLCTSCPERRNC